jgi:predicted phosphodiesterase
MEDGENLKNKEWEVGVAASDFHIPFQDDKAVDLLIYFLKDIQPNYFVINGDFIDCWSISKFSTVPKAGKDLSEEIEEAKDLLFLIRKMIPKTKIIYVEGNHEFRLKKYIIERAREIYGLKGLALEDQLELEKVDIEYIVTPEGENKFGGADWKIGDLYIGHYDKASKYSIANLVETLGVSFIQGHDHRFSVFSKSYRDGRELIGVGHGCMCSLKPTYLSFPNWQQGFSVFYKKIKNNRFQVYPVRIVDYKFFWGNKEYNLEDARQSIYGG